MGRSEDCRYVLATLNKHPAPDHLRLIEGMENVFVPENDQTQWNGIGRTIVLEVDRPAERLSICCQLNFLKIQ